MNKIHKSTNKGFTLLEILLIIALIGILSTIVLLAINPNRQLAQVRNAERRSEVNTLYKALEQYLIDKQGYPGGITDIEQDICINNNTTGCVNLGVLVPDYVTSIPVDPTGISYKIGIVDSRVRVRASGAELGITIAISGSGGALVLTRDPLDQSSIPLAVFPSGLAQPGSALVMPNEPCGPGIQAEWRWLRNDELILNITTRYYVIGSADIRTGNQQIRGQLRCPGDINFQDTEQVDLVAVPGRQVERLWGVDIVQYGFVSYYGGWYDSSQFLDIEFDGDPYNNYAGIPSQMGYLILGSVSNGQVQTQRLTYGHFRLDGRKLLWVVASRFRDAPSDPWTVIEYEANLGL